MYDKVDLLRRLRWGSIPYANLRYRGFKHWSCGAEKASPCDWPSARLQLLQQEPLLVGGEAAEIDMEMTDRMLTRTLTCDWSAAEAERWVRFYWPILLEDLMGPIPSVLQAPCCAEFVISAELIRARPLQFYQALLGRLNAPEVQYPKSFVIGIAFALEFMHPVIFGEATILLPVEGNSLLYPNLIQ